MSEIKTIGSGNHTLYDTDARAQLTDINEAVAMTVTEVSETTYPGNIVDASEASITSSGVISGLTFQNPVGTFYSNPFDFCGSFLNLVPYDSNDNAIGITRSGTSYENITLTIATYLYKVNFSSTTVILYVYQTTGQYEEDSPWKTYTYTLASEPSYWTISGKDNATYSYYYGLTAEPSETYVAYAAPTTTYSKVYASALNTHIADVAGTSATGNHFEASCNLIDESKFDFTSTPYWYLESGYYFPVTAGKKICASVAKPTFQFYDSSYTLLSQSSGIVNPYTLYTIPANSVYARMFINASANTLADIQGTIMVYEVASTVTSNDDRRDYVPPVKIVGDLVEGDIYGTAVPTNLGIDILTAAQYKAVRALNHQRNAFRISTFNIYVSRVQYHWAAIKQELKDYAIDICAMQEVSNSSSNGRYIQNYLTMNTWQFKYGSQASFNDELTGKAVVSVYEVVSTEHFDSATDGREYIKTVINLPQYKHFAHQFTLSVYSAHLDLGASNRLTEVSEILATIANDTSDFIIICADTNAFESEADAQGKRPTWEAFIAGGFTPIHYGESPTVTDGSTSIDQIFMGSNISCLYYDVVNSNNYQVEISGNDNPISDHDMVYADLQFDFDAVLAAL